MNTVMTRGERKARVTGATAGESTLAHAEEEDDDVDDEEEEVGPEVGLPFWRCHGSRRGSRAFDPP